MSLNRNETARLRDPRASAPKAPKPRPCRVTERVRRGHASLVARASSSITSGFEAVGSATTSGFKAVKRHVRYPMWARFMTAGFVVVSTVAAATAASLLLYLGDIADALDFLADAVTAPGESGKRWPQHDDQLFTSAQQARSAAGHARESLRWNPRASVSRRVPRPQLAQ